MKKDSVWHYNLFHELTKLKETIISLEKKQNNDWFLFSEFESETDRLWDAVEHLPQNSKAQDMDRYGIYSSIALRESSAEHDFTLSLSCEDEHGKMHHAIFLSFPGDRTVSSEVESILMHAARFPEAELPEREVRRSDIDFIPNETIYRIRNPYRAILKDVEDRNHFKQAIEAYMRECKSGLHEYPYHDRFELGLAPTITEWQFLELKRSVEQKWSGFSLDDWMRSENKEGAAEPNKTEKSEHAHSLPDNVIY